jgi:large subunit ribosomal protein L17
MRHLKRGRKLGRNSSHRKAMFRNMVTSLLLHGQIKTTLAKAKELRSYAEKIITIGKNHPMSALKGLSGDDLKTAQANRVHAIRRARVTVNNKDAMGKLFGEYAELYKNRPGGYTRVVKAGYRKGDNAPMAIISLVDRGETIEESSKEESSGEAMDSISGTSSEEAEATSSEESEAPPSEELEATAE